VWARGRALALYQSSWGSPICSIRHGCWLRLEDPLDTKGLRTQAQRIMKAQQAEESPGRSRASHSHHTPRKTAHGQPHLWHKQSKSVQLALTEQGHVRRCVGCTQLPMPGCGCCCPVTSPCPAIRCNPRAAGLARRGAVLRRARAFFMARTVPVLAPKPPPTSAFPPFLNE
jgi:hypothetical protein